MDHVKVEHRDRVAIVTLVDERRRNAISEPMVAEIVVTFDELEATDVGAIVVTGAPPAFCSGADVGNLARLSGDAAPSERASIRDIYEGFLRIRRSVIPTIAAVNGPAVGAGLNMALACDLRLAGASARFDARFAQIGLHPGGGHTWLLERAIGPQHAAAMLLFGQALGADEAVRVGLAYAVYDDDDALLDAAVALGMRAANIPRPLAARVKQTLGEVAHVAGFDEAVETEVERQTWSFAQGWFPRDPRSD